MPTFDPQKLAQTTGGAWQAKAPESISGFCFDARQIEAGQCFVALSAGARDGHEFISQAKEGGALAAIVESVQDLDLPQLVVEDSLLAMGMIAKAHRENFTSPVIGVTGSCGKTSTKEMLRCLLGEMKTHATAGNWNNRIGVPMTLFDLESQDFAVIEAGINQPGEMKLLGEMIQADINVVTNIGSAHLELLHSLENIAAEKSQLAMQGAVGSAIICPADVLEYTAFQSLADRIIALVPKGEALNQEVSKSVEYALRPSSNGHELTLFDEGKSASFKVHSSSQGICVNAALAIIAARALGIADSDIVERIQNWQPGGNRGRTELLDGNFYYVDCYNANPDSMRDALKAFDRSAPRDVARLYILGAMNELGADAANLHENIGRELALRPQDRAIFIGPAELVQAYQLGALSKAASESQLQVSESIEKIKSIVADFQGALFLKGSRSYQLEKLLPATISNS